MGDRTSENIDSGGFDGWYFLAFMLWGYYDRNMEKHYRTGVWSIVEAIASIVLFFAYKKMAERMRMLVDVQVVIVPLLLGYVIFAFGLLTQWLYSFGITERGKKAIGFLAGYTLEIYIVQVYLINWLVPMMPFSIGVMVTFVIILIAAWLLQKVTGLIDFNRLVR